MDEEVVLGKDALKAISSDARINIMKALLERQKTQSEIALELGFSAPTILEHMEKLLSSKLIEPVPEYQDKKWKYFRLTKTGRTLIEGKRASIVLMLSYVSAIITAGLFFLYFTIPSIISMLTGISQPNEPTQPSSGFGCGTGGQISCALSDLNSSAKSAIAILAMAFLIITSILLAIEFIKKKPSSKIS